MKKRFKVTIFDEKRKKVVRQEECKCVFLVVGWFREGDVVTRSSFFSLSNNDVLLDSVISHANEFIGDVIYKLNE